MLTGLEDFFKSLRRNDAQLRQNGERKAKEGKSSMPFGLYRWLCCYFISKNKVFEWVYLTICWNLMCRTNNIANISLSHLSWFEDSLQVIVPKTKTDQGTLL
jgi:cellulose synthase/poly-beta-1,6-N-acetylglucosamine synthase-like glycosyltransferase